jgi:hypothetical protein
VNPDAIVRPLRVYLDTSIYQHSLGEGYPPEVRAQALSRTPSVVQVISLIHCLEFAKKGPVMAKALQAMVQEVTQGFSTWVKHPWTICQDEWRAIAAGEVLDPESVFGGSFADIADKREPGALEALSGRSVYELIDALRSSSEAQRVLVQKLGLVSATEDLRQRRNTRWTRAERLSRALARLPHDAVGEVKADLDLMPGNRLMVAHDEGSLLTSKKYGPTDVEDNYHLGCAAYCDVAFVDADTYDRLRRAKYRPKHLMSVREYPAWARDQIGA